jgi:NAD-specific glutamate dehydrogenase
VPSFPTSGSTASALSSTLSTPFSTFSFPVRLPVSRTRSLTFTARRRSFVLFPIFLLSPFFLFLPLSLSPRLLSPRTDSSHHVQLFFGPDEGTANYMAWLADHARSRGASWWKASSTGKPASTHGGIPHDVFGMTSLSVRAYTTGIYRKCASNPLFFSLFSALFE